MPIMMIIRFLLNPRFLGALAILGVLGYAGYMAHKAKIRTAERDDLRAELSVAKAQLNAQAAISAANIEAIENKMEADRERSEFTSKAQAAIEAGRIEGDGPVAPVLRDTLGRVRERAAARLSEQRDP